MKKILWLLWCIISLRGMESPQFKGDHDLQENLKQRMQERYEEVLRDNTKLFIEDIVEELVRKTFPLEKEQKTIETDDIKAITLRLIAESNQRRGSKERYNSSEYDPEIVSLLASLSPSRFTSRKRLFPSISNQGKSCTPISSGHNSRASSRSSSTSSLGSPLSGPYTPTKDKCQHCGRKIPHYKMNKHMRHFHKNIKRQ